MIKPKTKTSIILLLFISLFSKNSKAQQTDLGQNSINTISTAASFLMIAPDARGGALGDMGVATSPDGSSQHWNPAKYAFLESQYGISVSYSPWLRKLATDMNVAY